MTTRHCKVINKKGMHARAAAKIVTLVGDYNCQVTLKHKKKTAPGDSLIKLLTLNAPQGSIIEIDASGENYIELLNAIDTLFQEGFGE